MKNEESAEKGKKKKNSKETTKERESEFKISNILKFVRGKCTESDINIIKRKKKQKERRRKYLRGAIEQIDADRTPPKVKKIEERKKNREEAESREEEGTLFATTQISGG